VVGAGDEDRLRTAGIDVVEHVRDALDAVGLLEGVERVDRGLDLEQHRRGDRARGCEHDEDRAQCGTLVQPERRPRRTLLEDGHDSGSG